jgi:hypothetical protein
MKSFNDENSSIHDLKYEHLFKILKEKEDQIFEEDGVEEEENDDENEGEEEESAIEISSDEYLRKVSNVIKKIILALNSTGTTLDHHFLKYVNTEQNEFRAIELARLVQILNEEFNIILDSIDIYCLFTKLKHLESENENETEIEEIVDYDKLIYEIKNFEDTPDVTKSPDKGDKHILTKQSQDMNLENSFIKKKSENYHSIRDQFEIPNEDFIQHIKNYLKKHKISFEEFIAPLKNKIQNETNRFIDITNFENFLLIKEIIVIILDPIHNTKLQLNRQIYSTPIEEKVLCSNEKINLDYLKSIIENNGNNGKQFVTFNS